MAAKPDYYELLEVPRDADADTLKKAFRKLAIQFHPDKNDSPDAEEKFKAINQAYAVLSDPEKRARYDRFGHDGPGIGPSPSAPGVNPADLRDIFGSDLFEEMFGAFFGGGRPRRPGVRHGRDVGAKVKLSLEDVARGADREVHFTRAAACQTCGGTGARPGTSRQVCDTCRGQGQVRVARGFLSMIQPCPDCEGEGTVVAEACPRCRGRGTAKEEVNLAIKVPPGVESGHKLRIEGEGEAGRGGGQAGDLIVALEVENHPFFERKGEDLECEVPITFPQAALGAQIEVPTLEGKAKVKIPAGTQSGKVLRLRGKGLPSLRSMARGDQLVKLQLETPTKLNEVQKKLIEAFERTLDGLPADGDVPHQPRRKSFLDKLKALFD